MQRRHLLQATATLPIWGALAPAAHAQASGYPSRPVKIVVGFGAGGNGDVTVRIVAEKLAARLGQGFVVENRPGAGGLVAGQQVLQSPADGYTLMLGASSNMAMTPHLFSKLPYDTARDFVAVSMLAEFGFLIVVNDALPIRTVPELVAHARANPGKLNIGSIAVGSAPYIGVELFKAAAGIECTTVPFKNSGEVVAAARSGQVQLALDTIPPLQPHLQSGALRAIGVTTARRFPSLPDVPTVMEQGVPYEMTSWNGLVAPRGTPDEVLDLLNREIKAVLAMPDVAEKYRGLGVVPTWTTRQAYQDLIQREIEAWGRHLAVAKIPKS